MKWIVAVLLFMSAVCSASAEQEFEIKGVVRDLTTHGQLMEAEVEVHDGLDSVVGKGKAFTGWWNGMKRAIESRAEFKIKIPRRREKFTLRISYDKHETLVEPLDLTDMGKRETSRDLGTFYLDRERNVELKEVTVTASKVKFYNRGDTIVFNADAFELAEGSMLDALIEQLPGVEIRKGGEIYVNGEYVESLLLNGKDFFNGNKEVMLNNLGAFTVKNVEVYRKTSETGRFVGSTSEFDKKLVMDVNLKKEYIGGWNINAEAGGATSDRYLGRLFAMHFNATSQYTVFANANNLNDYRRPTGENTWNPNDQTEGQSTYQSAGFDYSNENSEGTARVNGNVLFTNHKNNLDATQTAAWFLPSGNTFENKLQRATTRDFNFSTEHQLRLDVMQLNINIRPQVEYRRNKIDNETESSTGYADITPDGTSALAALLAAGKLHDGNRTEELINASMERAFSGDYHLKAVMDVWGTWKMKKNSDYIDYGATYTHENDHSSGNSSYLIGYGDPSMPLLARQQHQSKRPGHTNKAKAYAQYNFVTASNVRLSLRYQYDYRHTAKNSAFYLAQLQGDYSGDFTAETLQQARMQIDPANSYETTENRTIHSLVPGIRWEKGKLQVEANLPLKFTHKTLNYVSNNIVQSPGYNRMLLNGDLMMIYRIKGGMVQVKYEMTKDAPDLMKMVDVANTTNPLAVYLGNPELKAPTIHSVNAMWYGGSPRTSYYLLAYAQFIRNKVAEGYSFAPATGTRYYMSSNVDGDYTAGFSASISHEFKKKVSMSALAGYYIFRNNMMIGETSLMPEKVSMTCSEPMASAFIEYSPAKWVTASLNVETKFSLNTSSLQSSQKINYNEQQYQLRVNFKLPYHWEIRPALSLYDRNGFEDPELDKANWVLNARVQKSFMKGKWIVKLDAYDMLHQVSNITYAITPQSRVQKVTNTIPRYVMLHVQYRVNIQPKKQVAQTTRYF